MTTTVATFAGSALGDMAGFTVSIPNQTWMFHFEPWHDSPIGGGPFYSGIGDERIVLADALFSVSTGSSFDATVDVIVNNVAPVIESISATSAYENGVVHLTGTYSDVGTQDAHELTIDWGEGSPQTVVVSGGSFDITHQYLDDSPSVTPADNYLISVTLADDDLGSDIATTSATVSNIAPELVSLAAADVDENGTSTLTGTFADPGTLDTFTVTVDWGDGSPTETFSYPAGTAGFTETHQYVDDNPSATSADS